MITAVIETVSFSEDEANASKSFIECSTIRKSEELNASHNEQWCSLADITEIEIPESPQES